jgi:hypothetical protein
METSILPRAVLVAALLGTVGVVVVALRRVPETGGVRREVAVSGTRGVSGVAGAAAAVALPGYWWPEVEGVVERPVRLAGLPVAPRGMTAKERVSDPESLRALAAAPVSEAIRLEAWKRLCEITKDEDYGRWIAVPLTDASLPGPVCDVLMRNLRERPLELTARGMLAIAAVRGHPGATDARYWLENAAGRALPDDAEARREAAEKALGFPLPGL